MSSRTSAAAAPTVAAAAIPQLLTTQQVAFRLSIARKQVYTLIEEGRLKAINVGRRGAKPSYRIASAEIDRFIRVGGGTHATAAA